MTKLSKQLYKNPPHITSSFLYKTAEIKTQLLATNQDIHLSKNTAIQNSRRTNISCSCGPTMCTSTYGATNTYKPQSPFGKNNLLVSFAGSSQKTPIYDLSVVMLHSVTLLCNQTLPVMPTDINNHQRTVSF